MSAFPAHLNEPFRTRLLELYNPDTSPKINYLELGRQILSELEQPVDLLSDKKLSDKIADIVRNYRIGKGRAERLAEAHPFLKEQCDEQGLAIENVDRFWNKTESASILTVIPKEDIGKSWEEKLREHVEYTKQYAPSYPTIDRTPYPDGHLLVVSPTDIHIGKLASAFETGEDYNNQIAVQRALEGVRGIIKKAQGFNIDKVLFVIGNDILHIDTPKRLTTGGTPQDTDGMWYDNYLIAKRLYIEIIEMLLTVADVHIQYDPSNHDYTNGFFLADTITSWFGRCENVTFDTDIKHRKYFSYFKNLIGTTHGDGAKTADLPLLMAHEEPVNWGICKHRYFYTGHLHHKVSKDYMSVCVETLRSPSSADSWHSRNGYQYAPVAIEGFVHSKEHGQICRLTHIF